MNKDNKTYPLWMFKPKYHEIYKANNQIEEREIIDSEGGYFDYFDHEPTSDEMYKSIIDFNFPDMTEYFKQ